MQFEIVGTLDFLPKIGFSSLESEWTPDPCFFWWNTYLVKVKDCHTFDVLVHDRLPSISFSVVDNIDESGHWFIIKDTLSLNDYIVVNKGVCPCVMSKAEITNPKSAQWFHIGLSKQRSIITKRIDDLLTLCSEVYLVVGIHPTLKVCDYMKK